MKRNLLKMIFINSMIFVSCFSLVSCIHWFKKFEIKDISKSCNIKMSLVGYPDSNNIIEFSYPFDTADLFIENVNIILLNESSDTIFCKKYYDFVVDGQSKYGFSDFNEIPECYRVPKFKSNYVLFILNTDMNEGNFIAIINTITKNSEGFLRYYENKYEFRIKNDFQFHFFLH